MNQDQDKLLDSNYDGIQEYDNDLPRWWVWLFYITIIFSIGYVAYYMFMGGPKLTDELAVQMQDLKTLQDKSAASAPAESEETLIALTKDASALAKGKEIFVGKCVVCHGPDGQGLIGPNLTDKYWIHGGKITDIHTTVEKGVLDKGMLSWKGVLPPQDLNSVVAYVYTLRGTNPPNPKAPQGDPIN